MRRGKSLEKVTLRGSVANGPFSSIKTVACKPPSTPDLGAFVRKQIAARQKQPNPIGFALPDGTKGRAWLASDKCGPKIVGDHRLWRINIEELLRQKERRPKATPWTPTAAALSRPIIVVGRNDPVRDIDDVLKTVKGFKILIYIEGEKESWLRLADRHLSVSRQQGSSSPQRQRRDHEAQSLQGIAGSLTGH
jgi:hypothetical protein